MPDDGLCMLMVVRKKNNKIYVLNLTKVSFKVTKTHYIFTPRNKFMPRPKIKLLDSVPMLTDHNGVLLTDLEEDE